MPQCQSGRSSRSNRNPAGSGSSVTGKPEESAPPAFGTPTKPHRNANLIFRAAIRQALGRWMSEISRNTRNSVASPSTLSGPTRIAVLLSPRCAPRSRRPRPLPACAAWLGNRRCSRARAPLRACSSAARDGNRVDKTPLPGHHPMHPGEADSHCRKAPARSAWSAGRRGPAQSNSPHAPSRTPFPFGDSATLPRLASHEAQPPEPPPQFPSSGRPLPDFLRD